MKLLVSSAIVLVHLMIGSGFAIAQVCTQATELGSISARVVFESGVVLVSSLNQPSSMTGRVEIYEQSPVSGVFEMQQTLTAEPVRPGERYFGFDIDTDGDTIVVSSEYMNFPGERSAVYIFERSVGLQTWEQVAKFIPPASSSSHIFLGDVAVSGDQILIGAPYEGPGEVYVVERDSTTGLWSYGQTMTSPAGAATGLFGQGLDLDGELMAIGDPWASSPNSHVGVVHTFERSPVTGVWSHAGSLNPVPPTADSYFGKAVAVQGNRVLAGAPQQGLDEGAIALWERHPGSNLWQLGFA
ncbi:MAG: hypothetical protein P1V35_16255, partial [Planctomycetota bacterium]|nr:hypothetical protein [Planctomycetota bacterium]